MSLPHLEKQLKTLERHKKFQIIVSVGTLSCIIVGAVAPSYTMHVAVINAFTNLLWIWEK